MSIRQKHHFDSLVKIIEQYDVFGRDCILRAGDKIVYKACRTENGIAVYVKIRLSPYSRRCSNIGAESKIDFGYVDQIYDRKGNHYNCAYNRVFKSKTLKYEVGKIIWSEDYSDDIINVDGCGIYVVKYKDLCNIFLEYS